MTAQVFRNGQQPTFYVSDALSPGSSGIDASFHNLTVTNTTDLGGSVTAGRALTVHATVLNQSSVELVSPASTTSNGIVISRTAPAGIVGEFGVNTSEAVPSVYVLGAAGIGVKIVTNAAERLRILSGGLASDSLSTESLALANGSTTVVCRYPSGAGTFTPTWVTFGGFSVDPSQLIIHYIRSGNQVMCTFFGNAADLTGAAISAGITVPFPSAGLVGSINAASGAGSVQGNGVGFVIFGNSGVNNRVSLSATVAAAPAAGSAISGSFMYTIS